MTQFKDFLTRLEAAIIPIFMEGFNSAPEIEQKTDFSLVSHYDRKIEKRIQEMILKNFPGDSIIGEEMPAVSGEGKRNWYVDPIDGTRSYLCGNPLCGVLVGAYEGETPVFGAALIPALNKSYVYGQDGSTKVNGRFIKTSGKISLESSIIACTSPDMFNSAQTEQFKNLSGNCLAVNWGGDCYNYVLLAEGRLDLVMEVNLKDVDIFPLIPLIQGAGGKISDHKGMPIIPGHEWDRTVIAAANPKLHGLALAKIMEPLSR